MNFNSQLVIDNDREIRARQEEANRREMAEYAEWELAKARNEAVEQALKAK
jgi:hypothetical protein